MIWIFLAIAAHFCWSLVNIGEKYIVTHQFKEPLVYFFWLSLLSIVNIVFIPFTPFFIPSAGMFFWIAIASITSLLAGLLYIKALQQEEVSRINIWWNLIPIFSFVIAWATIGDVLTWTQIIAFCILLAGAFIASLHHTKEKRIIFSKAFILMLLSCFSSAVCATSLRYITQSIPLLLTFIWQNILVVFLVFFLFFLSDFRKAFITDWRQRYQHTKRGGMILGIFFIDNIGRFLHTWALSLGPVALVYAMEGAQSLFVFSLASCITWINPHLLQENVKKENIVLKTGALIAIIFGIIILNIS